jgi:outer membrane protein OmpA-like peptidoglycan-associated protein
MKQLLTLILLLASMAGYSQGGLIERAKQRIKDKAIQRADNRIDREIDKGLDKVEEDIDKKAAGKENSDSDGSKNQRSTAKGKSAEMNDPFESYSRYDFIPGANVLFAEDFSEDVIGEFPLLWATNNRGEIVTVKNQKSQWLRMFQKGHFLAPQLKDLPDNFTIEFDMILTFPNEGYVYPAISFRLIESAKDDKDGRKYLNDVDNFSNANLTISPGEENSSTITLDSYNKGEKYFTGGAKSLKNLGSNFGKPFHVAIWVQKTRLRMWIDGEKIYDIPQAVPADRAYNRLGIGIDNSYYDEEKVGAYITNVRIAEGAADIRNKLLTEGKLVTQGILFDIASDKIKPESTGVIKEIAAVLKDNPSVKIKIVGHTDSDGDDQKNLDLSKRRAASVKSFLRDEFRIDESRIQTDGMGESKPVADNNSKEGKANNRRVEFIKQ